MPSSTVGPWRPRNRVESIKSLKKGRLYLSVAKRYGAVNLIRILSTAPAKGLVTALCVNPWRPKERRLENDKEFVIFDFYIKDSNIRFYSVRKVEA